MSARSDHLLGTGLRHPLLPAADGGLEWLSGPEVVAQSLRAILLTQPGERIGRPTWGVGLRRFLFAPNDVRTRVAIRQAVSTAIERDEPRAELEGVDVVSDALEGNLLRIVIRYRVRRERESRSLVFPCSLEQVGPR
jgi:phage baseplate assembly protein W